jgi:hypothetical protein
VRINDRQVERLKTLATVLFWTAIGGYVVWFGSAVYHGFGPGLLWDILTASPDAVHTARATFVTLPGITTLTQVAPLAVAAFVLLYRIGRRYPLHIAVLLLFGLFRFISNSERLALLELILPALVVIALVPSNRRRTVQAPVRSLPSGLYFASGVALGCIAFILLFALSERSRSYASDPSASGSTILWYSTDRLLAYYATSTNNGVHYYDRLSPGLPVPEVALQWLWNFPVLGAPLHDALTDGSPGYGELWPVYLEAHANPEFNSSSVILPLFGELGPLFAGALLVALGLAFKRLFDGVRRGSPTSLLVYASCLVGLLELPRFLYFAEGRTFPLLLACVVTKVVLTPPPGFARSSRVARAWSLWGRKRPPSRGTTAPNAPED